MNSEDSLDIDDFISSLEMDPDLAKHIAEARKWVGDTSDDDTISLRSLRLAAGLSQRQLADLIGVKQPNISAIEAGKRKPEYETAKKLAGALGVKIDDIYIAVTNTKGLI